MGTVTGNLIRPTRRVLSASKEALLRKRVQGAFKALNHGPQIPPRPASGPAPLSFAQQRLWFLQQLEPSSPAYNVPTALRLSGPLDLRAFQEALRQIHLRHEILRAAFPAPDGTPVQIPTHPDSHQCRVVDLQHLPADQRERAGAEVLAQEAQKPFDLVHGPASRYTLLRYGPDDHVFSIVMHHIVTDGWSVTLFFRELEALYDSLTRTLPAELPPLAVQYADFATWQREAFDGDAIASDLNYWKKKLASAPPVIDLPSDRDHQPAGAAPGASKSIRLTSQFCAALSAEARSRGATDFIMLAAALAIALERWTGQSDLVIGTVAAGRTRREIENLIGCFMNFLPLRVQVPSDTTAAELLTSVKATILEAYAHQDCPFDKIVEAINPARGVHRNPLYNVALLLQNFPSGVLSSDILSARFVPVETRAALLDLRFVVEQDESGMSVVCEYDTQLFDPSTIETFLQFFRETLARSIEAPRTPIADFTLPQPLAVQAAAARARRQLETIAVAATFTADPVEDSLMFWLDELGVSARLAFAPYNQVFQQLLEPASVLNQNRTGLNVILCRLQDWAGPEPGDFSSLAQTAREFSSALRSAAARLPVPWLVCMCPGPESNQALVEIEYTFLSDLRDVAGIYLLTSAEILRWYPVERAFDAAADRLGNVPYTPAFFAALGTAIVRKFHALKRAPRKVIALDCDNTLWDGVCGEDGPHGIRMDSSRRSLQEFMARQAEAGMLLCLCTKNNQADIDEVFRCRSDFVLRRENFVAARVNWKPKSENLKSLARELNVGLDSFIFVDDNPTEIAEVEANCPGVVTLRLPDQSGQISSFLDHAWIFDHLKVTAEDQKRVRHYEENRRREELRAQCVSMEEFLAGLNLNIVIEEARPEHFARVSQLTQRTNQFNFTTRRYTDAEIQELSRDPRAKLFVTTVSDRFGDYGLVGVMIARIASGSLDVDTFLLSCRVLGKGVEHRMLSHLGALAQAGDLARVDLHFRPSPKNRPALDFLERTAAAFRQNTPEGSVFHLPSRFAASVRYQPGDLQESTPQDNGAAIPVPVEAFKSLVKYRDIALNSHDPQWILGAIEARRRAHAGAVARVAAYAPPRSRVEHELCGLWARLLAVERVGIQDDFFSLGGSSLLAVRLFAQIEKVFGKAPPLVSLFQAPTIEKLAQLVEQRQNHAASSSIVPIQTTGARPPLILVHGAGGGILWGYANLASHLGPDQPVYAIEPRGPAPLTVEQMAERYLADVRAFQPKGPYYIGGYCFGGYVAYEIARLLHAAGETVALLALIDSAAPNGCYDRIQWNSPLFYLRFARNTWYRVGDYLKLPRLEQWRLVLRKLGVLRRKLLARSRGSKPVDIQEYIDPIHFPEEELRLWQVHLNAGGAYIPKPYPAEVTLLRTRGQPFLCSFDPEYGWGELAAKVNVRMIPGAHESVFVEPDVRALAAEMAACISEIQTQGKNTL